MLTLLFKNKPFLFLLIAAGLFAILFIGFGIYIFFPRTSQNPKNAAEQKPMSLEVAKYPAVIAISPAEYTLLTPENTQTFTVQFHDQIDVTKLHAILIQSPINTPAQTHAIALNTRYDGRNHTLTLTTETAIIPESTYILTVKGQNSEDIFLKLTYHSTAIAPTRVPSNNLTLRQYLPHETSNYILSYNTRRNTYVFNFKYDPAKRIPIAQQFNAAKAEAQQFIKSKGVNPNTINIEWRRS